MPRGSKTRRNKMFTPQYFPMMYPYPMQQGTSSNELRQTIKMLKALERQQEAKEEKKKKEEDEKKKKSQPEKRKLTSFEVAMIMTLFSPFIGFLVSNAYISMVKYTLTSITAAIK